MGLHSNPQRYLSLDIINKIIKIAAYHSQDNNLSYTKNFVMSDIHGMDQMLIDMLDFVTAKCQENNVVGNFIFLGDYVDRGPGVAQVLAIVRLLQESMPKGRVITLMGNHEDMFLAANFRYASDRSQEDYHFTRTGVSFGLYGQSSLPPCDLLQWMDKLPHYYEDETHYYVHAGIKPGIPIEKQTAEDLIWIREQFLHCNVFHPKYVIHGHTPSKEIVLKSNRCCIDTGAVFSDENLFTCAEVDSDKMYPVAFYQVSYYGNYLYNVMNEEGNYKIQNYTKIPTEKDKLNG